MYDQVADLSLTVEDCAFELRERATSSGFDRATTTIALSGAGDTGRGEDVTYTTEAHRALVDYDVDLAGEYTLDSFSAALSDAELWPAEPDEERFRHYRRSSDPTPAWDDDLVASLSGYDVRVLDLKGLYDDPQVATDPDPEFYRRVADGVPDALLEDPNLTDATRPVFDGREDRVTWDVPVTGVESIEALPFEPAVLNMKPSRCGTVESVLSTIAYCERTGIELYGGGQFELGVGRDHIQALASLWYPDAPNDVAPGGYNDPEAGADLPASPLAPPTRPRGIGVGFGPDT